ncbi:Ankyrin repeat domain-containing protein 13C, partial [Bienertia sinuspersici]
MLTWRCQEKTDIVGQWKAKVLEMHNVVVSVKSRKVPGAMTDDEEIPIEDANGCKIAKSKNEKKGWFDGWRKRDQKSEGQKKLAPPKSSVSVDGRKSDATNSSPSRNPIKPGRHSMDVVRGDEPQRGRDKKTYTLGNVEGGSRRKEGGLRPILCLSPNFPLRAEELSPLLDILAHKVKAIRRLRELLTTTLPLGTFPVK